MSKSIDKYANSVYNNIRNKNRNAYGQEEKNMNTDKMIDMIVKSYITVMGEEKWNSLSDEQKHDVVMTIATDALNRIK